MNTSSSAQLLMSVLDNTTAATATGKTPENLANKFPVRSSTTIFTHEALDHSVQSIRLIHLLPDLSAEGFVQCRVRHTKLVKSEGYTCLSYVWGPADLEGNWIIMNGRAFSCQKNLASFLRHARQIGIRCPLWIDGLCINQLETTERNHQVQLMGQIYEQATKVISWLGDGKDMASFFAGVNRGDFRSFRKADILNAEEKGARACLQSEYWDRAWITQEILLARKVIFMAGSECVTMDSLRWTYVNWRTDGTYQLYLERAAAILNPDSTSRRSLLLQLSRFRNKACNIPHDRVFSLVTLCEEGSELIVDYNLSLRALAEKTFLACPMNFCLCTARAVSEALNLDKTIHPWSSRDFQRDKDRFTSRENDWYETRPFARIFLPVTEKLDQACLNVKLGNGIILLFDKDVSGVSRPMVANLKPKSKVRFYTIQLKDLCSLFHEGCVVFKFKLRRSGFWYQVLDTGTHSEIDETKFIYRRSGLTRSHNFSHGDYCQFDLSLGFLLELTGRLLWRKEPTLPEMDPMSEHRVCKKGFKHQIIIELSPLHVIATTQRILLPHQASR